MTASDTTDFFRPVSWPVLLLLPLDWMLLPVLAFNPEVLRPVYPDSWMYLAIRFQYQFYLFFIGLTVFRAGQAAYATIECQRAGMSTVATVKWATSAFLSGMFALKLLRGVTEGTATKKLG